MKRLLVAAMLLTPVAANAGDVTFQSHGAHVCQVTLDKPELIVAWAKTVAGVMSPEDYLKVYSDTFPGDREAMKSAKEIIDYCLGDGV